MAEIKDLAGISEPIKKFIEVVAEALGVRYKPKAIRSEADAEAYRIETIARAEQKKALIEQETQHHIEDRAEQRVKWQEIRQQINLESIIDKTPKHLGDTASNQPVDADWRTRFFQKAQDISNEELQEIWAKILASEVTKPGTISLRTLEVISNLSRKEADLFKIAHSITSDDSLIWNITERFELEKYGLPYTDVLTLIDAGLLHPEDKIFIILKPEPIEDSGLYRGSIITIGKTDYQIYNSIIPPTEEFNFKAIMLTNAGQELSKMIEQDSNQKYVNDLIEQWMKKGYKIKVKNNI